MKRTSGPLDVVPALVFVLDREGQIQQFNRAGADLLGAPNGPPEASFWSFLPRGNADVEAAAARLSSGPFPTDPIELECDVGSAGSTRRVAWTLSPDELGDIVATGVDVTAWHRELEAVRAERERLRMVINAMPDPVFLKDGEGRWVEVNPKAVEVFGLSGVEYQGRTDAELSELNPFYRQAHLWCVTSDEQAWAKGTLTRGEEIIQGPKGPPRIYDTYKSPIFHPDGTRKGLVVLGRDISERVWAEEALRRREAQLRLILETAPDLIGLAGPDGKVQFINPAAEALLGVSRDEMIGHSFAELEWKFFGSDGQEMPVAQQPFARAQEHGQVRGAEMAFERPDGRRVVLAVNAAALSEPRGAVVFAATDVTRQAEIEQMKGDFLKIASHELRTPLTPLRLLLEKSRRSLAHGGTVDGPTLARMERQVETLTHLVDELLDVARLERGHFVGAPRTDVDLAHLVGNVVSDFRLHAQAAIDLEVPSASAIVSSNPWALERVVSNLIDNALKYSSTGVEVSVSITDDHVRVSVRDHGPGIAPEHRANLFDRFYRVLGEATMRRPGLGLGLFITRELLRELGSDIDFESEVDKGSTFHFTLPLHHPLVH